MGAYQYFYKEKDSEVFSSGKYAGISGIDTRDLHTISECDTCDRKEENCSIVCYGCYPKYRIKISKEDLHELTKDLLVNQNLLSDIMDEMNQDYLWFYEE